MLTLDIRYVKDKHGKIEAQYSPGMKSRHCAICKFYISPNACKLIEGKINPGYWCKYFERKA